MKKFANLFQQIDRTTKTNEKVELLKAYFLSASDEDKIWALALFTGRRPSTNIKSGQLTEWALEMAGIPLWLYRESYNSVGDMAETISLLLPVSTSSSSKSLNDWFQDLAKLKGTSDELKKEFITNAWRQLSPFEIFVFNKLMMGSFRIGVSQTLVIRAVSEATNQEASVVTHRVMGHWDPFRITYKELIQSENPGDQYSRPYPFYLAYAIENTLEDLGEPGDWFAEWKWDGIRAQIIFRNNELYIWSRGEELVTDKFPELSIFSDLIPEGTVLDGEILCFANDKPLPFNVLQTRIGRKNITKKILQEAPVAFIAYDILEFNGKDIRNQSQSQRRDVLERVFNSSRVNSVFRLSSLLPHETWEDLNKLHLLARENVAEGFMIKRKEATYQTGRKKGDWWKWKIDPLSIDAVLIYAQKGHGRRAELYTDYTFAVWDKEKLVPFAKAYSGLTDAEIREVDRFVKQNTLEKFGPVRTVKPQLVFEIGFEGINESSRHKSGIAVRFPRMLRWRKDKPVEEADTLENLKSILETYR
ncbi:MAG: ATP-dependent DNA ligase [Cyclobacteriaceae bacterium]|nr:ATP-dependent DNA ligase [Cyclobacteriaceae bacterium]